VSTQPSVPEDVRKAVVDAYYPRALTVSDNARGRAQAAYGVASAIAAALVAAGVFGDLGERTTAVQVLGVAALVAWLIAAGLFLFALSAPFYETPPPQEGAGAFVYSVLDAASRERRNVDQWSTRARWTSIAAGLLTVLAFGLAVFSDPPSKTREGRITLMAASTEAVADRCPRLSATFAGRLDKADLEKEFVSITPDGAVCGEEGAVISVPRAQVRAVVFDP